MKFMGRFYVEDLEEFIVFFFFSGYLLMFFVLGVFKITFGFDNLLEILI